MEREISLLLKINVTKDITVFLAQGDLNRQIKLLVIFAPLEVTVIEEQQHLNHVQMVSSTDSKEVKAQMIANHAGLVSIVEANLF